jgi:hypothetical protein
MRDKLSADYTDSADLRISTKGGLISKHFVKKGRSYELAGTGMFQRRLGVSVANEPAPDNGERSH